MGFSRQEYWGGLLCPPAGDLPDPGIKLSSLMTPALVGRFLTTSATREAQLGTEGKESTSLPGEVREGSLLKLAFKLRCKGGREFTQWPSRADIYNGKKREQRAGLWVMRNRQNWRFQNNIPNRAHPQMDAQQWLSVLWSGCAGNPLQYPCLETPWTEEPGRL